MREQPLKLDNATTSDAETPVVGEGSAAAAAGWLGAVVRHGLVWFIVTVTPSSRSLKLATVANGSGPLGPNEAAPPFIALPFITQLQSVTELPSMASVTAMPPGTKEATAQSFVQSRATTLSVESVATMFTLRGAFETPGCAAIANKAESPVTVPTAIVDCRWLTKATSAMVLAAFWPPIIAIPNVAQSSLAALDAVALEAINHDCTTLTVTP